MIVHHVVPHIWNEASGPSVSVPSLCRELQRLGVETHLHALHPADGRDHCFDIHYYPSSRFLRRLGISGAMRAGLYESASRADLLHNHSLWMMPNIYPGEASRRAGKPLVIAPRGTMSEWAFRRSRIHKALLWHWHQHAVCRRASLFHATAESEIADIRRRGFLQPVALVPNGVSVPAEAQREVGSGRTLLFLGRVHPTKGVASLLEAWAKLAHKHPEWSLNVVGPDNGGYLAQMEALAAHLGLQRVNFSSAQYGASKIQRYQQSDLFVLPTHSENFGMTIAESLACGTPAITTKGAPWEGLEEHRCGMWIDHGVGPLVAALDHMMSLPPANLGEMGSRGREWMLRDYSWDTIGRRMRRTYEWVLGGGDRPNWIDTGRTA